MTYFDVLLWAAVPLNYFFWIVVYPKLSNEWVPKTIWLVLQSVLLWLCSLVVSRLLKVFTWWLIKQNCCSSIGKDWVMKITTYQANANMLREAQQVIHQKNLQELQRLNHQKEQTYKVQQVRNQWARANSVDVMVWNIYYCYCCLLDVKTATGTSVKTQTTSMLSNVRNLDVNSHRHALSI